MAYARQDDAFYSIQDDRSRGRGRGHYAGNMFDNAGYHGYKQGISGGGSYKLKPLSNTNGFSEYPGEGSAKSSRRCCVVMAVVGMMFLLGAALAIGIYFGVVDKPESLRDPDITTTTVAPAPALSVDMSLTIDRTFDTDLYNPDSQTYKDLETEVKEKIDQNMKNSPQGDSYSEAEVLGFSQGSIVVLTRLKFAKKTVVENNVEVELTPEKIITTFKDQLDQSNTVLFVKDQITAKIST
ncbi:uncharacterized protein LOC132740817, partial [Ruditapes philippinarum]|uniref:uncharacterized protein LOC132740817 n=1 Tax=Ruditapes philippinarum TaxID=129788 RepID=UPI00295B2749